MGNKKYMMGNQGVLMNGKVPVARGGMHMEGSANPTDKFAMMKRQGEQSVAQHNYLQYFGGQPIRKYKAGGISQVGGLMQGVGGLTALYGGLTGDDEAVKWGSAIGSFGQATSSVGSAADAKKEQAKSAVEAYYTGNPEAAKDAVNYSPNQNTNMGLTNNTAGMTPPATKQEPITVAENQNQQFNVSDTNVLPGKEIKLDPSMDPYGGYSPWGQYGYGRKGLMAKYGCYMKPKRK